MARGTQAGPGCPRCHAPGGHGDVIIHTCMHTYRRARCVASHSALACETLQQLTNDAKECSASWLM